MPKLIGRIQGFEALPDLLADLGSFAIDRVITQKFFVTALRKEGMFSYLCRSLGDYSAISREPINVYFNLNMFYNKYN